MNITAFLSPSRPLVALALAHVVLTVVCVVWLRFDLAPIRGVHPAMKPLKFAISIAMFLGTLAWIVPTLSVSPGTKSALAWVFALTMLAEIVPIVAQAVRGTTSHFNVDGGRNAAVWMTMIVAIVVATFAMLATAILASSRPLVGLDAPTTTAVRWGLWILLLAAWSGFAMGGRSSHSVGGVDGGVGLPFLNWSVTHGDLRAAHFFALHGLQVLPAIALALTAFGVSGRTNTWIVTASAVSYVALCCAVLGLGFAGRPMSGAGALKDTLDAGPGAVAERD